MSIPNFGPTSQFAKFSTLTYPTVTPTTITLAGAVTATVAQLLSGLLRADPTGAQTLTLPTAAAVIAAINGCQVGNAFEVDVINYGDNTLTITLGAGMTKVTIHTVAAVLTIVTLASKKLRFCITNVTPGSEAIEVYASGSVAAAVA